VLGKAATAHILHLVESALFPTEIEDAKVQLKAGGLDRPKDSLVRAVIDNLVLGFAEGSPKLKARRQTAVAIRATYDMFPGICEPRVSKTLNAACRRIPDSDIVFVVALQRHLPQVWAVLEPDNRNKVAEAVKQSSANIAKKILPIALSVADLEDACRERIGTLQAPELEEVLKVAKSPILLERATHLYCTSLNWDAANSRYQHAIEPVLNDLTEAQLRRILFAKTVEGADLNYANSFWKFLEYIYVNEKLPRAEIEQSLRDQPGMDHYVSSLQQAVLPAPPAA
jgi:hypothetical protein